MERIKRFFSDESGGVEISSEVLMVGLLCAAVGVAVGLYYTGVEGFYQKMETWVNGADPGTFPPSGGG